MKYSYQFWMVTSCLLLIASGLMTLLSGETPLKLVWEGVLQRFQSDSLNWNPLLDERLPRLIILICTGASLAVSGLVTQSLFHNSLATPSILGISAGGCLCVILVFVFGWQYSYPFTIPLAAFGGCFLTLCLVYSFCYRQKERHLTHLVLTGIAFSTLLISIQGLLLYALRDQWQLIQTISEWEAGTTTHRTWQHVHMQLPVTLVGLGGCLYYQRELNLLALGEEDALSLGVEVKQVRWRLFLFISLLTGGALATMGMIAFFGLILPHIGRQLIGCNHLRLVPFCILAGASILTGFDASLRFFGLQNLSLSNLSAVIGGLFFLYLLIQPTNKKAVYS